MWTPTLSLPQKQENPVEQSKLNYTSQSSSQEYLTLIDLFFRNLREPYKLKNAIDLGCGTGVLSILAAKYQIGGEIIGIDDYKYAVECTKMNSQVFGYGSTIRALQLDLTKLYFNKLLFSKADDLYIDRPSLNTTAFLEELRAYKSVAHQIGIPSRYDIIMCNPPWIPAAKVAEVNPLDNGVYDPEEKFLKSALNFGRLHLSPGKVGRMLLIYSDLAQILGIQKPERVEELIHHSGLFVEEIYQIPMRQSKKLYDPLVNYKAEANVQLFEIFKP